MRVLLFKILCMFLIPISDSFSVPVLIVPGFGGSCLYDSNKKKIWPSASMITRAKEYNIICTDTTCMTTKELKTSKIGDLNGIRLGNRLTELFIHDDVYMPLIATLHKIPETMVFAMPYDFRLLLNETYITQLYGEYQEFIESSVRSANGRKCVVFCHSLGGLVFHDFLAAMGSDWARMYVSSLTYVNCPFDGSIMALRTLLGKKIKRPSFFNDPIGFLLPQIVEMNNFGGLYWCLPWRDKDKPLVHVNGQQLRITDFKSIFELAGICHMFHKFQRVLDEKHWSRLHTIQGIKYNIFCSTNNKRGTPVFIDIDTQEYRYALGDGVVTHESMLSCFRDHIPPHRIRFFNDTSHSTVFYNKDVKKQCVWIVYEDIHDWL